MQTKYGDRILSIAVENVFRTKPRTVKTLIKAQSSTLFKSKSGTWALPKSWYKGQFTMFISSDVVYLSLQVETWCVHGVPSWWRLYQTSLDHLGKLPTVVFYRYLTSPILSMSPGCLCLSLTPTLLTTITLLHTWIWGGILQCNAPLTKF